MRTFKETSSSLWAYGRGYYKAYTENYKIKNKLSKLRRATVSGFYYNVPESSSKRNLGWDVTIPSSGIEEAERILHG